MSKYFSSCLSGLSRGSIGNSQYTCIPYSKISIAVCSFLFRSGWLSAYNIINTSGNKVVIIYHKFVEGKSVINRVQLISKPGHRINVTYDKLFYLIRKHNKKGYYILSTSYGIISSDEALFHHIGGELLAQIFY